MVYRNEFDKETTQMDWRFRNQGRLEETTISKEYLVSGTKGKLKCQVSTTECKLMCYYSVGISSTNIVDCLSWFIVTDWVP